MENNPIRVLHVLGRLDMGGAESRTMDLYRMIDRSKVQFDFMIHTKDKCFFDDEIESLGGHIYHVPRYHFTNHFAYVKAWKKFFEEHKEIKVVHGHMTSTAGIYIPIAKQCGVGLTIAHSRSAGVPSGLKGYLTKLLRLGLYKKPDVCIGCSKLAGIGAFGQKAVDRGLVTIVPNAIDTKKFEYNENTRKVIREELGIDDSTFVVGHVGRFHESKNHEFLFKIFKEIKEEIPDSKLVLVGDGELRDQVDTWIKEIGITEDVIKTGNKKNVEDYYQAFDYFVFPSRYEGLPGTVVEAQASGLRCLMSDNITNEVMITDLVESKAISDTPESWAKRVLETKDYERFSHADEVKEKGFDAGAQIDFYTKLYLTGNLS